MYFSGELHYRKGNAKISFDLFKQLFLSDSIRVLILEMGFCKSLLWNDYLENNNPLWRKYSYRPEEINFAKALKGFYDSLPSNDKFKIVGVDFEIGYEMFLLPAINTFIQKNSIDTTLESTQLILSNIRKKTDPEWWGSTDPSPIIKALKQDIEKNETQMISYWGENYKKIKKIISDYDLQDKVAIAPFNKKKQDFNPREKYIYKNLLEVYMEFPTKKIFVQFGRDHVLLTKQNEWIGSVDNWNNWEPIAAKLNTKDDSPFKNKVCCIFRYYPKVHFEKWKYIPIEKKELKKLEKLAENGKATLFDLKCINPIYYNDIVKTKFQYLIINKY